MNWPFNYGMSITVSSTPLIIVDNDIKPSKKKETQNHESNKNGND